MPSVQQMSKLRLFQYILCRITRFFIIIVSFYLLSNTTITIKSAVAVCRRRSDVIKTAARTTNSLQPTAAGSPRRRVGNRVHYRDHRSPAYDTHWRTADSSFVISGLSVRRLVGKRWKIPPRTARGDSLTCCTVCARLCRYEWRLQSPVDQCPCVGLTNKSLPFGRRCC